MCSRTHSPGADRCASVRIMVCEIRKNGETIDPMPWLERTDGHNIDRAPASFSTVDAPWSSDCDARL